MRHFTLNKLTIEDTSDLIECIDYINSKFTNAIYLDNIISNYSPRNQEEIIFLLKTKLVLAFMDKFDKRGSSTLIENLYTRNSEVQDILNSQYVISEEELSELLIHQDGINRINQALANDLIIEIKMISISEKQKNILITLVKEAMENGNLKDYQNVHFEHNELNEILSILDKTKDK